jgi:hypothetical protein
MSQKCHFKSKSTNFYVTSTKENKDKDDVITANGATSVPPDSVRSPTGRFPLQHILVQFQAHHIIIIIILGQILTVTATSLGVFTITGVTGLYVSLNVSSSTFFVSFQEILSYYNRV